MLPDASGCGALRLGESKRMCLLDSSLTLLGKLTVGVCLGEGQLEAVQSMPIY